MAMEVANEILRQLGGDRFVIMTGAKMILGGSDFLQFGMPRALTPRTGHAMRFGVAGIGGQCASA